MFKLPGTRSGTSTNQGRVSVLYDNNLVGFLPAEEAERRFLYRSTKKSHPGKAGANG